MEELVGTLGCEALWVCEVGGAGQLEVLCSWGAAGRGAISAPRAGGLVARALAAGRAALEALDARRDGELIAAAGCALSHAAVVPMRVPDRSRPALLIAGYATPPADKAMSLWTAEACAMTVSLCLRDAGAVEGLLDAARRDPLTGCLTYGSVRRELEREMRRCERGGPSPAVCFIDLDAFGEAGDRLGHRVGDELLAAVGRVLCDGIRRGDSVGRHRRDEFVLLLPHTSEAQALLLAKRLRALVARVTHPALPRPLSASIGVAGRAPDGSAEELLRHADHALLLAKARGLGLLAWTEAWALADRPDAQVVHGFAR
jgi:diguanylate cyclase (GGDEF)-like protein